MKNGSSFLTMFNDNMHLKSMKLIIFYLIYFSCVMISLDYQITIKTRKRSKLNNYDSVIEVTNIYLHLSKNY